MSGRPTAEIVAELRDHLQAGGFLVFGQAADRLTELDAEVETCQEALMAQAAFDADLARVAFDALRPPCPTCGGTTTVTHDRIDNDPLMTNACTDCVDGKVSIERLAAVFRELERLHTEGNDSADVVHLRSVR